MLFSPAEGGRKQRHNADPLIESALTERLMNETICKGDAT
jgi:hypothetical protein